MIPHCASNSFYPEKRWPSLIQNNQVPMRNSSVTSPSISPPPLIQSLKKPHHPSVISVISAASSAQSSPVIKSKPKEDSGIGKEELKRTSSTTREVHNRLEKNRRAHLKQCFDELAVECDLDPKKASNLTVIRSAYKSIMSLRRKERENEKNLAALVQDKIRRQNRLEELKREFPGYNPESDGE